MTVNYTATREYIGCLTVWPFGIVISTSNGKGLDRTTDELSQQHLTLPNVLVGNFQTSPRLSPDFLWVSIKGFFVD